MESDRDVITGSGSRGYLLKNRSVGLACLLRGMTTFAALGCLRINGAQWCCRSRAKCPGCPCWDGEGKLGDTWWKTASISKSTRRHYRRPPRPLHPIMAPTPRRKRSRRHPGESGKFSPERIASIAMDASSWPGRVGSCPSPWALSSSQVFYSLYLSEYIHICVCITVSQFCYASSVVQVHVFKEKSEGKTAI